MDVVEGNLIERNFQDLINILEVFITKCSEW